MKEPRPAPAPGLGDDAHKGDAGRVLLLAGSAGDGERLMPGAAVLAARGALRGGAGLVSLITLDQRLWQVLAGSVHEALLVEVAGGAEATARVRFELERRRDDDARAVGPGLGQGPHARLLVEAFLHAGSAPLVVDADGLNAFAGRPEDLRRDAGQLVVTPHPGEAARLLGRPVGADPAEREAAAREIARRTGGICILKGRATVVTDGNDLTSNSTGGPGLATGGTGDVLSGLLAAYLANVGPSFTALEAATAATWVHGRAGDLATLTLGPRAVTASDVVDHIGAAQRELSESQRR